MSSSEPPSTLLQLPQMRSYDEALAVSEKTGDPFFVWAFALQGWIRDLMAETLLTYSTDDHRPCDVLQDGLAWAWLCELFGTLNDQDLLFSLQTLFRFTHYDNRFSATLARALVPLTLEQQLTGRPCVPQPSHSTRLLRRTAMFWCDWLEATIHLEVHRGVLLYRCGAHAGAGDDLAGFGHPVCRLPALRQAMPRLPRPARAPATTLADLLEHPSYPGEEIETILIGLQPLAKRYHWTAIDLFDVIIHLVRHAEPDFCWATLDLHNYRRDELGLSPLQDDDKQLPGPPAGLALAALICPPDVPKP